jgi:hypothetical protein
MDVAIELTVVGNSRKLSRLDIGHHHSPTKMLRGDREWLVADKLANGNEPKDARRGCAIAIAIMTL